MARLFHASFDPLTPTQQQQLGLWALVGTGIVSTTGRTGNGVTGTAAATQADNTLRTKALAPATAAIGFQGFALKLEGWRLHEPASHTGRGWLIGWAPSRKPSAAYPAAGCAPVWRVAQRSASGSPFGTYAASVVAMASDAPVRWPDED